MDRSRRLRESFEITQTRTRGRSAASGPLVVRVLPNQLEPPRNRYTVVAGKRIGKAHDRNRCKRVTREALRLLDSSLIQGNDVVVILRGGTTELPDRDSATRSLAEAMRRVRLLSNG
jgi:ribonuclease P protein component